MNYNDIKGPNGLAVFYMDLLSDDTCYAILKDLEKADRLAQVCIDSHASPIDLMRESVSSSLYTAGYNLVHGVIGEDDQDRFDEAING